MFLCHITFVACSQIYRKTLSPAQEHSSMTTTNSKEKFVTHVSFGRPNCPAFLTPLFPFPRGGIPYSGKKFILKNDEFITSTKLIVSMKVTDVSRFVYWTYYIVSDSQKYCFLNENINSEVSLFLKTNYFWL